LSDTFQPAEPEQAATGAGTAPAPEPQDHSGTPATGFSSRYTLAPPPVTDPGPTNVEEARHALRTARNLFLGALAVGTVVGVSTGMASDGGFIWTGGFIFGGVLLFRSVMTYRHAHSLGARLNSQTWIMAGVALAVALCVVGWGVSSLVGAEISQPGSEDVGPDQVSSCWHDQDEEHLTQVACDSSRADWVATKEVTDVADCPDAYVEESRTGYFLCLDAK
jgi:hypothetical protein